MHLDNERERGCVKGGQSTWYYRPTASLGSDWLRSAHALNNSTWVAVNFEHSAFNEGQSCNTCFDAPLLVLESITRK